METKQRNREHYGSKIKKYRVRKGLPAEALALSLRVSLSTVRNWEAGISRPDLALLSPIFALLDYTIEVLNNGHDVRIHPYRDGTYDIFELERKGQVPDMWPFKGTKL